MKDLADKLDAFIIKHKDIEKNLSEQNTLDKDTLIQLNKEYAELTPIVEKIKDYQECNKNIHDLLELQNDSDLLIRNEAEKELKKEQHTLKSFEIDLFRILIPKDTNDGKNSILEIRAGTGGEEASLFAANLFNMYQKYSDIKNWNFEVLSISETGLRGIKEVICNVSGKNIFARLKFESGVHRVQRVPDTEASGRIHTSAATVAVLPEVEDIEVKIDEKDLRIDVFRASGPGGQSVNTTDSAVRITHIPTNIVVQQQDEKSQHKNKAKALKILRARIYDYEQSKLKKSQSEARKNQVGTGDRSERIRTYNFPQGRVTDHRINLTLHKLEQVLSGESLDEIIDKLLAEDKDIKLANLN